MPQTYSDIIALGAGASRAIQPPVGQDWLITDLGCSVWAGIAPAGVPSIHVDLTDGGLVARFLSSLNTRGWGKKQSFFINNVNYLLVTNPAGGFGVNYAFSAKLANDYGAGASGVISDLVPLATGISYSIRPAVGFEWLLTDFGSNTWLGGPPLALPDMTVELFDGALGASVRDATNFRGWYQETEIYADNSNYVRITNTAGGGATLGFMGAIARIVGTAASLIMNDVITVGAGGVQTIRPPAGEEWKITEIGSSVWLGGAPAQLPDVTVEYFDGALAAIIARATDIKNWMNPFEIFINRDNYLRITDTTGGGQNIGFSGIKTVVYQ